MKTQKYAVTRLALAIFSAALMSACSETGKQLEHAGNLKKEDSQLGPSAVAKMPGARPFEKAPVEVPDPKKLQEFIDGAAAEQSNAAPEKKEPR